MIGSPSPGTWARPGARRVAHFVAALTLTLATVTPRAAAAQTAATAVAGPPPIRVVDIRWLADHLRDRDLVVIQVEREVTPETPRIPGARVIPYRALVVNRDGLSTELPPPDSLASLFASLGVNANSLVVVTTSYEPPMAARGVMSLDVLGHNALAFLSGGVHQWKQEGRALTTETPAVSRGTFTARPRLESVVDAAWITARQGKGLALIDTRTDEEYTGAGGRNGMPSDGHPTGARQLQWEQLFADEAHQQLLGPAALRALYANRMQPGDTLVTYCWIGYRASMTYVAARTLGLPVRFYDGSYQDWQKRGLHVEKGR
ncbi:MAG: hypothetical protein LCH84_13980 [Gemmatimonadetes bacterium]|nr:hypothetical protein [Gemmatimonadota bacterium]